MADVEMGSAPATPQLDVIKSQLEVHGERVEPSTAGYPKLCVAREGPPDSEDTRDLVAFTQVEFLVSEAEPEITISVARRGPATEALEVKWHTENANIAPASYIDQSGVASWAPGEKKTTIVLQVIDNPQWSTESFQFVVLEPPEGNAVLGELFKTSMVILNDDPFPQGVEDLEDQARARARAR